MKYLVSHQNEQSGPFTVDEIVGQIRAKELELFDYIYDLEKDDWVLLVEFAPVAQKLKGNKPAAPPKALTVAQAPAPVQAVAPPASVMSSTVGTGTTAAVAAGPSAQPAAAASFSAHAINEWFVLKGDNRFGPFTYTDLVKMLQQKTVFPFDFVWHTGMEGWKRVVEVSDFTPENIRKLFADAGTGGADVFVQRRFERAKFGGRVIVHDGLTLWRGEGLEISRGGVGVTMQNTKVLPGQQLTLHFGAQEKWPAFNAVCEVVSKKFVSDSSPVEYGLRFLSLSQETQAELYKKVA